MSSEFGGSVQVSTVGESKEIDNASTGKAGNVSRQSTTKGGKRAIMDESKQASAEGVPLNVIPQHVFGSLSVSMDGLLCYSLVNPSNKDDVNERIMYRAGRRICVYDPASGKQEYFKNRATNVTQVNHFSIDFSTKLICLCESVSSDRQKAGVAQASIFSVNKLERLKTLSTSAQGEYICSAFTGENKFLATLLDEGESKSVHIWQWEKDRIHKTVVVPLKAMKLSAHPKQTLITTSGPGHLKGWYIAPDASVKCENILPPAKEAEHNFLDHCFVPIAGNSSGHGADQARLVTLADSDYSPPPASRSITSGQGRESLSLGHTLDQPSLNSGVSGLPKQVVFVLEGPEQPMAATGPPVDLQLRTTLIIKVDHPFTILFHNPKGIILGGPTGALLSYENNEDSGSRREPYVEQRAIVLPDQDIVAGATYGGGEQLALLTRGSRLLKFNAGSLSNSASGGVPSFQKPGDNVDNEDGEENKAIKITDMTFGGHHNGGIIAADGAAQKPLVFTIADDNTCRIWNFQKKKCELVHSFRTEEPLALSVHFMGTMLLVSFKLKVKLYNVLMDRLQEYREVTEKNCNAIKFSRGGQYFAVAANITIKVYDTRSFLCLREFQGHMMTVKNLTWGYGDDFVFSAGIDGNVYGWPLRSADRIDMVTSGARKSIITTLETENYSHGLFDRELSSKLEGNEVTIDDLLPLNRLLIASAEGGVRCPSWCSPTDRRFAAGIENDTPLSFASGKAGPAIITAMRISLNRKFLYAGTNAGSLRIYAWPPTPDDERYIEYYIHAGSVKCITESFNGDHIVTVGEDGSIWTFKLTSRKNDPVIPKESPAAQKDYELRLSAGTKLVGYDETNKEALGSYNTQVVNMGAEEMEEHIHEILDLQKKLDDLQSKFTFEMRNAEFSHGEELKKLNENFDKKLNDEKDRYESLQKTFDGREKELTRMSSQKEAEHARSMNEIENQYEHKLAVQVDRFDRLSEEMEVLKQRSEGLLEMHKADAEKRLNELEREARNREKRMRAENKRVKDEKSSDESAFKEILDQQEDEYEDELRQLIGAAESELTNERETIVKLRTLVQTKNTKLGQIQKKLVELTEMKKGMVDLLNKEKEKRKELQVVIDGQKKNLIEREQALAEKETVVLELRNHCRTLENFRFVLDSRLQQLSAERGPITSHIEDLESHISAMYEELVSEQHQKKEAASSLQLKENRFMQAQTEMQSLRADKRSKELYISGFKRELSNITTSNMVGRDLEEAIRNLYRKYVKGEKVSSRSSAANAEVRDIMDALMEEDDSSMDDSAMATSKGHGGGHSLNELKNEIDTELLETAKEANRQKKFVERSAKNLQHRLKQTSLDSMRQSQKRLMENSNLMYECNELRQTKKNLERRIFVLEEQMKVQLREINDIRRGSGSATRNRGQIMGNEEVNVDEVEKEDDMSSLGGSLPQRAMESVDKELFAPPATTLKPPQSVNPSQSLQQSQSQEILNSNLRPSQSEAGGMTLGGSQVLMSRNNRGAQSVPNLQDGQMMNRRGNETMPANLNANSNPTGVGTGLRPRLPGGPGRKGKTSRESLAMQRMANEVEMLLEQLDTAHREREMQRSDIARLRHQLVKLAGISAPSRNKIADLIEKSLNEAGSTDQQGPAQSNLAENVDIPFPSPAVGVTESSVADISKRSRNSRRSEVSHDGDIPSVNGDD